MAHRFIRADAAALGLSADFGLLDAGDAADSDRPGFVKSRVTPS